MITRVDGRRKGAEERGLEGGWDVPTQGYSILSVRGKRLSPSVWLAGDQSSVLDPGEMG